VFCTYCESGMPICVCQHGGKSFRKRCVSGRSLQAQGPRVIAQSTFPGRLSVGESCMTVLSLCSLRAVLPAVHVCIGQVCRSKSRVFHKVGTAQMRKFPLGWIPHVLDYLPKLRSGAALAPLRCYERKHFLSSPDKCGGAEGKKKPPL
jgi:hypothetical protein